MRTPVRIALRGHERRDDTLLLIFAVDQGSGELAASVTVDSGGNARFPHELTESGLPLGPVADAAVLERAKQTIAVMDAADTWRAMRRPRPAA